MLLAQRKQAIDLQVRKNSRIFAEACQINVGSQQFFRFVAEAIIECVDEVQAQRSSDQLKSRWPSRLRFLNLKNMPSPTTPII
jgi:hypothetical protein